MAMQRKVDPFVGGAALLAAKHSTIEGTSCLEVVNRKRHVKGRPRSWGSVALKLRPIGVWDRRGGRQAPRASGRWTEPM
eukprot:scaffold132459_cov31-Tisochrysis_lutea.AAC.1